MAAFTLGKSIILAVNLITMVGPYLADWNETHIYNPTWPPHARYHNGQTMSTGLFIGLITCWVLCILTPQTPSPRVQAIHIGWVLLLQNLVYLSSLSGIWYPGAGWGEPDAVTGHVDKPQLYLFPMLVIACWIGWYIELQRLAKLDGWKGKDD